MKKLLFLTKINKKDSREEILKNLLRHMFDAGFKIKDLPKKYEHISEEKKNG